MSRIDRLALLVALVAVIAAALVGNFTFDRLAHLEDEMAYVWQAELMARGDLTLSTPTCPECFLVPFVIDYHGLRFGKYPPGWPVVLALGVRLGLRWLVNPLLAGLGVWLTYLLAKKLSDEKTGLLAAALMVTSPFFLINSGSLLSHPWTLVLSVMLALAWLDAFSPQGGRVPRWLAALTAGLVLGGLAVTRPLTAAAVALPFILHALILLFRGGRAVRLRLAGVALLAGAVASLYFAWQYAVTGDALLNPYTLWWPYDRIGFGPGVGLQASGFSLKHAWWNTLMNLRVGSSDLFGWGQLSYLFIPFGIFSLRREKRTWLLGGVMLSLLLAYMLYWVGAWLFGPRYYYEALFALVIFSAAGIRWLAGRPLAAFNSRRRALWEKLRFALVTWLLVGLVTSNFIYYLPHRLAMMHNLYDVSRAYFQPFEASPQLAPALVIVHPQEDWIEYGRLLELSSPYHDTPFVFILSRGEQKEQAVIDLFPERKVWHYYADEPDLFYTAPRPPRNQPEQLR